MAASYWNAMNIANNAGFQNRIQFALVNAALAVVAEVNTTPNHATRVTYAQKVLAGTASILEACYCALNNSTILAEADVTQTAASGFAIPDTDIQFAINSDLNALAGVAT